MRLDRGEVRRYMRMGTAAPDAEFERRLDAIERQVLAAVRPASYWQLVPVAGLTERTYSVGGLRLESNGLRRVIAGCRHAFLFCATLGPGVDALLRRFGQTSAADLLMVQGVSAALIESYCDECEERMAAEPAVRGETLRMRYSPGYGDLPLTVQRDLLAHLDSVRRIGVTLTESMLMIPSKSVSAIIGVG